MATGTNTKRCSLPVQGTAQRSAAHLATRPKPGQGTPAGHRPSCIAGLVPTGCSEICGCGLSKEKTTSSRRVTAPFGDAFRKLRIAGTTRHCK